MFVILPHTPISLWHMPFYLSTHNYKHCHVLLKCRCPINQEKWPQGPWHTFSNRFIRWVHYHHTSYKHGQSNLFFACKTTICLMLQLCKLVSEVFWRGGDWNAKKQYMPLLFIFRLNHNLGLESFGFLMEPKWIYNKVGRNMLFKLLVDWYIGDASYQDTTNNGIKGPT